MDAATAAAMSAPNRNPHFHRCWREPALVPPTIVLIPPPQDALGTIGIALIEAWCRKQVRQQDGAAL